MEIMKIGEAQILEIITRNPVNDTQIHLCTKIDKSYQQKSQKQVKKEIPEFDTRNPEITQKGGRPITRTGA